MVAGNGRLRDLQGIVVDATDRGFLHIQFVCAPGKSLAQQDNFRHRSVTVKALSTGPISSQTVFRRKNVAVIGCARSVSVSRSAFGTHRTGSLSHAAPATP